VYRIFVSDDMGMLDGLTAALRDRTAQAVEITAEAIENADRLADRVAETEPDALVAGGLTPVDAGVLSATELDLVARGGVGYDNVDIETARERGVTVTNAPDYCREEVATHAVSLLVAATRRLGRYDRQTRSGGWDWAEAPAPPARRRRWPTGSSGRRWCTTRTSTGRRRRRTTPNWSTSRH
jgi:phosphoglycerate dehydrogenase-like enzyme